MEFHKDLISYLISDGYIVSILNGSISRIELSKSYSIDEVSSIELFNDIPSLKIKNIYTLYKNTFKLIKINKYQFILCFMINTSIFFSPLSFYFKNINFISTIEGLGSLFNKNNNYLINKVKFMIIHLLLNILFTGFSKFVFVNNDDQSYLNKKIFTIRKKEQLLLDNGNGIRLFKNNLKFKNNNDKYVRFIMVSRLMKEKGLNEFIEASYEVGKLYSKARFSHIGGEPIPPKKMDKVLKDKIEKAKHINFIGSSTDVAKALQEHDIFVLPSYAEGFSASIMEALATGLYVITSNAPGCRQSIKEEFEGELVEVGDVRSLVKSMINCCEKIDNIKRNSTKIRNNALHRFDSKINQKLIKEFIFL